MIWRYRKISNGHYDSHYFVCEDAGVIQKIIPNPGYQYTYSNILEIIADGIRCACDTKYAIVKRGFCTFDPLPKDVDKPDRETIFEEIRGIRDGAIFDVDPEIAYLIDKEFVDTITTDPRILYIMHRAHLEEIPGRQDAIDTAFAKIPSREEALLYLRRIGACLEWKPL